MKSKQDINFANNKTIKNLCILMMVSDRVIDNDEVLEISNIFSNISLFNWNEDGFVDDIIRIKHERNEIGLHKMVKKYSLKLKNKSKQIECLEYLNRVMMADGKKTKEELKMIVHLKELWNLQETQSLNAKT